MRSTLRFPLFLATISVTFFAGPRVARGQQGRLPWKPGDPPPAVAGLRLGATRATINSVLGKPENVKTLGPGVQLLGYRTRGIAFVYSKMGNLAVAYLAAREAGDLGGIRVGDPIDTVRAHWGDPTGSQENIDLYQVGSWALLVQTDTTTSRVALLGVAQTGEPANADGPYDDAADPHHDIASALEASRRDHKLVLLDFGGNWCADCIILDRLFNDPQVADFLHANFRVVHVDVGQFDRNLDVSKTYGNPIDKGVPAVVVLSPSGGVVASTADGSLESAHKVTPEQLLGFLKKWVAAAHR
ncbi:MAG: thioredoxin family protein [Gemmatimonadota bacterium]|jgi:thioredoxin 1